MSGGRGVLEASRERERTRSWRRLHGGAGRERVSGRERSRLEIVKKLKYSDSIRRTLGATEGFLIGVPLQVSLLEGSLWLIPLTTQGRALQMRVGGRWVLPLGFSYSHIPPRELGYKY